MRLRGRRCVHGGRLRIRCHRRYVLLIAGLGLFKTLGFRACSTAGPIQLAKRPRREPVEQWSVFRGGETAVDSCPADPDHLRNRSGCVSPFGGHLPDDSGLINR